MSKAMPIRGQRSLHRGSAAIVGAIALVLGLAGASAAANLCIDQNPNSVIFVPRFRVPAKGKCKAYTASVENGLPGCGASGQACTTPDGSRMVLGLTAFVDGSPIFFEVSVPLPIGAPTPVIRASTFGSYHVNATTVSFCSAP